MGRRRIVPAACLIIGLSFFLNGCSGGILGHVENHILRDSFVLSLPRTGQTTSYAAGDDGDILSGTAIPTPRFSSYTADTIQDRLTGLIWVKNGILMVSRDPGYDSDGTDDGNVSWQNALDYIALLNSESYGGFNDWRLPNINEIDSLTNPSVTDNGAWLNSQGFTGIEGSFYWSSTTFDYPGYAMNARVVAWSNQTIRYALKTEYQLVLAVRNGISGAVTLPKTGQTECYNTVGDIIPSAGTGQDGELQSGTALPSSRYIRADETVIDILGGKMWLRDGNLMTSRNPLFDTDGTDNDGLVSWANALNYVALLNSEDYAGYNDWHLPNMVELQSLVTSEEGSYPVAPWLNSAPFTGVEEEYYWSSTTSAETDTAAFTTSMEGGSRGVSAKTDFHPLIAVRDIN